jgi:hypothetical protein
MMARMKMVRLVEGSMREVFFVPGGRRRDDKSFSGIVKICGRGGADHGFGPASAPRSSSGWRRTGASLLFSQGCQAQFQRFDLGIHLGDLLCSCQGAA